MSNFFYNPYHFVPVKGKIEDFVLKERLREIENLRHDRYISKEDVYSGRIICRIVTEDPIFIGSERDELQDGSHRVWHFELNGKPAIPASTIRGMISSLAEAASNSALRVLEKRYYSRRADMRESLGAIGMIVKGDSENDLRLRPLALPSLPWRNNTARIPEKYQKIFIKPLLKVYVNGYREQNEEIKKDPSSFLAKEDPDSYCADNIEFWYIKIDGFCSLENNAIKCTQPYIKKIQNQRNRSILEFLNGQKANGDPISEEEYKKLPENEKKKYTRGILRVLGIDGREDSIPTTKKHEIFIPYPPEMENYPTFEVKEAIEKFEKIAKERAKVDNKLPYFLKGSIYYDNVKEDEVKIRENDIVFFEVDESNPEKVSEISISSIWRKDCGGTSYDYFSKICSELLPFNPKREKITLAEQMFGFVENIIEDEEKKEDNKGEEEKDLLSFASRLKFSFGIWDEGTQEPYQSEEVLLKILDSPKPPCPSFYFKPKNIQENNFIAKTEFGIEKHIPQGRKFYLHRYCNDKEPWKTKHENENLSQKSWIKPLKAGINFYFHIDFDNLTRKELSLLCYVLKPSENYRHKIGMGKSIGLGRINIIPEGIFIVNRMKRYSKDDVFSSNRYHESWIRDRSDICKLPKMYCKEKKSADLKSKTLEFETLRKEWTDSMDEDIRNAIELIGNPNKVECPVHTPQIEKKDIEQETFRWFVENERQKSQGLKPLSKRIEKLPTLNRRFNK